jgi:hypothetical protein
METSQFHNELCKEFEADPPCSLVTKIYNFFKLLKSEFRKEHRIFYVSGGLKIELFSDRNRHPFSVNTGAFALRSERLLTNPSL